MCVYVWHILTNTHFDCETENIEKKEEKIKEEKKIGRKSGKIMKLHGEKETLFRNHSIWCIIVGYEEESGCFNKEEHWTT